MLFYCLKCTGNTDSKDPRVVKTKIGRIMLLSNCAMCDSKKSRFIKEQEASGIIGSLAKSLNKIYFAGTMLFKRCEMNETINKFLREKLMPKMYLRWSFTKKGRLQKFKERVDSKYIYQNKLDKGCF